MVENCVGGYNSCMFAYGQVSLNFLSYALPTGTKAYYCLDVLFIVMYFGGCIVVQQNAQIQFCITVSIAVNITAVNACVKTGSGKTHTMLGDIEGGTRRHSVNAGMTPRVFEYLFSRIQKVLSVLLCYLFLHFLMNTS